MHIHSFTLTLSAIHVGVRSASEGRLLKFEGMGDDWFHDASADRTEVEDGHEANIFKEANEEVCEDVEADENKFIMF